MKRIYGIIAAFAALATLPLSCGENVEETTDVVFPAPKELSSKAGETLELSFEASRPWSLTSDKLWCTFETPAANLIGISGEAGKHTVTLVIGSEGLGFDETAVATISMSMGGETAIVATISRIPKEYELAVYDMEGNELKVITAGYGTSLPFTVKANFSFSAVRWDEEVFALDNGHISGGAGEDAAGGLVIVPDGNREKYPIAQSDNYRISFSDQEGKAVFNYPVVYAGMDPEAIETSGLEYVAGWNVNPSGTRFSHQISGNDSLHVEGSMLFKVICLMDEFEVLVLNSASKAEVSWVKAVKEGGAVRVSCEPNGEEYFRSANVYVLPKALRERLGDNAIATLGGESAESYMLRNKCLALSLTQSYEKAEAPDDVPYPVVVSMDSMMPWEFEGEYADKWNSEWPLEWKENWPENKDFPYVLDVRKTDDPALKAEYGVENVFEYEYLAYKGLNFSNFIDPNIEGWTINAFQTPDDPSEQNSENIATCTMYYMGRNLTQEMMEDMEGSKQWYEPHEQGLNRVIGFKSGYMFFGIEFKYANFAEEDGGVWKEPVYIVFGLNDANVRLVVVHPPVNQ